MLSNVDILEAMKNGDLVIEPFDEKQLRPAGLTFHLGNTILKPVSGKVVDIKKQEALEYEECVIEDDKPYRLKSGEFVLGHTLEKITLSNNLGALIEGRSTLARLGLTVVQTSMIVDTGVKDARLTLEMTSPLRPPKTE